MAKRVKAPGAETRPSRVALRLLVLWLHARFQSARQRFAGPLATVHERTVEALTPFEERELENAVSPDLPHIDFGARRRVLLLEPIDDKGVFPALTLRHVEREPIAETRIRLVLFYLDDSGELATCGYRFESPEGEGPHHFYHAQAITTIPGPSGDYNLRSHPWLLVKQPAFGLDADGPVCLLVCALLAVYGYEYLGELKRAECWGHVTSHLSALEDWRRKFQPNYWRATLRQGGIQCYRTYLADKTFRERFRMQHVVSSIDRIVRSDYYKCAPVERLNFPAEPPPARKSTHRGRRSYG
jgi:hypothetical protein